MVATTKRLACTQPGTASLIDKQQKSLLTKTMINRMRERVEGSINKGIANSELSRPTLDGNMSYKLCLSLLNARRRLIVKCLSHQSIYLFFKCRLGPTSLPIPFVIPDWPQLHLFGTRLKYICSTALHMSNMASQVFSQNVCDTAHGRTYTSIIPTDDMLKTRHMWSTFNTRFYMVINDTFINGKYEYNYRVF
jgi:hypothetical protein